MATAFTTTSQIFDANRKISDDMFIAVKEALADLKQYVDQDFKVPEVYSNAFGTGESFPTIPDSVIRDRSDEFHNRIQQGKNTTGEMTGAAADAFATALPATQSNPVSPSFTALSPINPPAFSGSAPAPVTPNTISPPSVTPPTAPGNAPAFNMPAEPTRPAGLGTLPTAPTFTPVVIPAFPGVNLPIFTDSAPIDALAAPTERFTYAEPIYDLALQDPIKAKIIYDLENGGYGIEDADEQRLWDRARERDAAALGATLDELARVASTRGFTMPPGTFYAAAATAASELATKTSTMSRDIASKRADLYVQNRQFIIQTGVSFEKLLMDFHTSYAERMLNVAKLTVQLGIELFNAQVAKFNLQLDAYKTAANVYEIKIRAALASLEVYKAQLEGARIGADIQRIEVDKYRVQVEAATALIGVYQADVSIMKTKAEIESLRLAGFRSQVEAYASGVQAYAARFNAYEAEIRGETAKVDQYVAQVRGYTATVDAERTKVDAQRAVLDSQIAARNSELGKYKADIDWWMAEMKGRADVTQAAASFFSAASGEYSASMGAEAASYAQSMQSQRANADLIMEKARVVTQQLKDQTQLLIESARFKAGIPKATADTVANMIASVNTAISANANITE